MNAPTLRPDGSCPACHDGWQCAWHSSEGIRRDRERSATLGRVLAVAHEHDIMRI
jgi:hypothetical protein